VADVRVLGAIGVVEMQRPLHPAPWIARFVERGVWIKPFGNVVYLTPPLVIGAADLGALTSAIVATVGERAGRPELS
jgi:adenosylmethionine-8-amino-7-oxononanoate aminotransferase